MEDLTKYIFEEGFVIVPALWVLGKMLKISTVEDKFIIWVLLGAGITFSLTLLGVSVENFIQGILITGTAVFGHQLLKQTQEK